MRDQDVKTEYTRKLSNFNFQWTKTLYQNDLKNIAYFLLFSRAKDVILSSVITPKNISHGSLRKRMSNFTRIVKTQVKSANLICKMKFCEIWHSFSPALIRNFLWHYYRWLIKSLVLQRCKKRMQYVLNYSVTRFLSTEN